MRFIPTHIKVKDNFIYIYDDKRSLGVYYITDDKCIV